VQQEWFLLSWWHADRGPRQVCLELVKRLLGLGSPCKTIGLLQ
jgi:hypothetical protein